MSHHCCRPPFVRRCGEWFPDERTSTVNQSPQTGQNRAEHAAVERLDAVLLDDFESFELDLAGPDGTRLFRMTMTGRPDLYVCVHTSADDDDGAWTATAPTVSVQY